MSYWVTLFPIQRILFYLIWISTDLGQPKKLAKGARCVQIFLAYALSMGTVGICLFAASAVFGLWNTRQNKKFRKEMQHYGDRLYEDYVKKRIYDLAYNDGCAIAFGVCSVLLMWLSVMDR